MLCASRHFGRQNTARKTAASSLTEPGLEGIERCTQLDIAGSILPCIATQVDFPEIDLRQQLTLSRRYGVAKIHIFIGSEYVGTTIGESGLRGKDINALALYRGTTVIPNPRSGRQLEPVDRLLCFGKLEQMRRLIPAMPPQTPPVRKHGMPPSERRRNPINDKLARDAFLILSMAAPIQQPP